MNLNRVLNKEALYTFILASAILLIQGYKENLSEQLRSAEFNIQVSAEDTVAAFSANAGSIAYQGLLGQGITNRCKPGNDTECAALTKNYRSAENTTSISSSLAASNQQNLLEQIGKYKDLRTESQWRISFCTYAIDFLLILTMAYGLFRVVKEA